MQSARRLETFDAEFLNRGCEARGGSIGVPRGGAGIWKLGGGDLGVAAGGREGGGVDGGVEGGDDGGVDAVSSPSDSDSDSGCADCLPGRGVKFVGFVGPSLLTAGSGIG